MRLPRLYAIVDAEVLRARGVGLREFAEGLREGGVSLVQWRDKAGSVREVLAGAAVLRAGMREEYPHGRGETAASNMGRPGDEARCLLVMNDRADLAVLAGFDGVHVGQGDLEPEDARRVVGRGSLIGVSTHTLEQVRAAELSCADYVAVGPVFATGTKADAEAVIGLEGVRRMRALTTKPLVAIGGVTRANAGSVLEAGADSVAVISGLLAAGERVEKVARDFIELLR